MCYLFAPGGEPSFFASARKRRILSGRENFFHGLALSFYLCYNNQALQGAYYAIPGTEVNSNASTMRIMRKRPDFGQPGQPFPQEDTPQMASQPSEDHSLSQGLKDHRSFMHTVPEDLPVQAESPGIKHRAILELPLLTMPAYALPAGGVCRKM